ncbi:MAG: hypothetical protein QM770_14040 [Tepidisphaeraceae bacterium]
MNVADITATAKKHWIPLTMLVVALGAIVFSFVVVPGWFAELDTDLQTRKASYDSAVGVKQTGQNLTKPIVDPAQTTAEPLGGYPTAEARTAAMKALETLTNQSREVVHKAMEFNARRPIYPEGLNDVRPTATPPVNITSRSGFNLSQFQIFYLRRLNVYPTNSPDEAKAQESRSIQGQILHSANPPTKEELDALIRDQEIIINKDRRRDAITGAAANEAEIQQRINEMRQKFPRQELARRADASLMYVTPGAFEVDQKMATAKPDTTLDTFNAQLSLWQQESIADAIASVNAEAKSTKVSESPIKHLVALRLKTPPILGAAPVTGGFGAPAVDPNAGAAPAELTPDPTAKIDRNYTLSALGHPHNSFYDPYPFTLVIRVDARKVPQVLAGLTRGRFLAINTVSYSAVDLGVAAQQGFLYGDQPVYELTIEGDLILLREWIIPYMPADAKRAFAAWQTGAAPGAAPGAPGMTGVAP